MPANNNWTQYFQQVLPPGATSGTVVFPVQFYTIPVNISLGVIYPNAGATAIVIERTSFSATGFAFNIAPAVPASGYILTGAATAEQPTPQECGPCAPPGPGPQNPTIEAATVAIASGVSVVTGTFAVPFASTPRGFVANILKNGAMQANYFVTGYVLTATGFTVSLQGPTLDNTYQLSYIAVG